MEIYVSGSTVYGHPLKSASEGPILVAFTKCYDFTDLPSKCCQNCKLKLALLVDGVLMYGKISQARKT